MKLDISVHFLISFFFSTKTVHTFFAFCCRRRENDKYELNKKLSNEQHIKAITAKSKQKLASEW